MKSDYVIFPMVVTFPLIAFFAASIYSGNGLLLISLGLTSLLLGGIAGYRKSAPDLIFIGMMNYVIGLQVISLSIWPEFLTFQDGAFSLVTASTSTIDRSLSLLMALDVGWVFVLLFDRSNVNITLLKNNFSTMSLNFFIGWFSVSVVASSLSALFLDVGIAGVESDFQYAGLLYFIFPADYLVLSLCIGLGLKIKEFKSREVLLWLLIGIYLVVKVMCGWKSPILNVFLVYAVGVYYSGEIKSLLKIIPLCVLVVFCYIFIVKPAVDFVRTGEVSFSEDAGYTSEENPFASRLTEGTLYGVATIESGQSSGEVGMVDFLGDLINRLVPGTIWKIKSIDRVFTEDVLMQPLDVPSTFAPGSLGMAELLGGLLSALVYGMFFRLILLLLMRWCVVVKDGFIKLSLLGSIPIFIVSLCVDGYSGGVEKLMVFNIVVAIMLTGFSFYTTVCRNFLAKSSTPVLLESVTK